jgi:hypothetical protein
MTFKYKAIVVSSLLLYKKQLVPLVLVPSFLKIDANQIVSMFMDLYRRWVWKYVIMCLRSFFTFLWCISIKHAFLYVPLCTQVPDTVFVSRGRKGVNPRYVAWNFFLLKLVTLWTTIKWHAEWAAEGSTTDDYHERPGLPPALQLLWSNKRFLSSWLSTWLTQPTNGIINNYTGISQHTFVKNILLRQEYFFTDFNNLRVPNLFIQHSDPVGSLSDYPSSSGTFANGGIFATILKCCFYIHLLIHDIRTNIPTLPLTARTNGKPYIILQITNSKH